MNLPSNIENIPETTAYTLFGPSKSSNQGLLMISSLSNKSESLSDSMNLIQPPLKSNRSISSSSQTFSDRRKLFVGNLPSNTTLEELIELFGKYGRVNKNLSVVKDDNYAFIHFFNESDAEQAHKELNDSFFKSRYIRVQYSISQGHIKKPKVIDIHKSSSQYLSASSSYSSLCSNENFAFKLSQSQSVMSFNNLQSDLKQIGRPIKKSNSINKNFASVLSSSDEITIPFSQSFDQIGLINSIPCQNQLNLNNYIYLKSLLQNQQRIQQLQQLQQLQLKLQHRANLPNEQTLSNNFPSSSLNNSNFNLNLN